MQGTTNALCKKNQTIIQRPQGWAISMIAIFKIFEDKCM
jgi:hypothetical protein